jgi:hypothetical protein
VGGRRLIQLAREPIFELTFWCGTCPTLFKRLEKSTSTMSIDEAEDRLSNGLVDVNSEVTEMFGRLLPPGRYLPLLAEVAPRLTSPSGPGDYFAEEQLATWGLDAFWGLPQYPATPYYRTFETAVSSKAHLFEFVVPMVPPSWNDEAKVAEHAARLQDSSSPTAVAVSVLDISAPAVNQGTDYYEHWCLTHFLLDGHHKLQAAAASRLSVRLLSLVSVDASLASAEQIARLQGLLSQTRSDRPVR